MLDTKLQKAMFFADDKHINQRYRGQSYLIGHLFPVYEFVRRFSSDSDVHVAAILHDIVEDTDVTIKEIEQKFGHYVAFLVSLLTDESGKNRKERKAKTYKKIVQDSNAILIKIADRYVNTPGEKYKMYADEYPEFRKNLYNGAWLYAWYLLDTLYR